MDHFIIFILFSEGDSNVGLSDLLIFVTGLAAPPPLGFAPPLSISFLHDKITPVRKGEAKPDEAYLSQFPIANTCGNSLQLPLANSYKEFKTFMENGILMSPGFGKC